MSPLIPLGLLLLGTLALTLGVLPRFRFTGLIAVGAALVPLIAILMSVGGLPTMAILSAWGPVSLLPHGLLLEMDAVAWLFAVAALGLTLATLLTGVARPGGRRVSVRSAILLVTFAGLTALLTRNVITRVMAWAGLDLIYFLTLILLTRSEGVEPQAVLNLSFNSIGTLLALSAAVMISRESAALSLRDAALTSQSTLLITLAAVFRLGLFPLHLGLPAEANLRQGLGTILRLIPAAVALETLGRLASFGFAPPARAWLTLFGIGAAWVGALQLWAVADARQGLTYLIIAHSGLALLAGLFGAPPGVALTGQALALVLGGALVFLANGHNPARARLTLWPLLGVGALLGLPLTPGWVGWSALYNGLLASRNWLVLLSVLGAQVILGAGLLRATFWPAEALDEEPLARTAYFSGLLTLAVLLSITGILLTTDWLGLRPSDWSAALAEAWPALIIGGFAVGAGWVGWRYEPLARARLEALASPLLPVLRLDWLYRAVWAVIYGAGWVIRNLAEVLEGEGAMLWALVVALLVWLLLKP